MSAPFPPINGTEPCADGDPERFHPIGRSPASMIEPVITECRECRVREECLAYALTHSVSGIWGATTYEERILYRKEHGIEAVPIVLHVDRQMVVRAHQRGMTNEVIASLAEVNLGTVEHIVSRWRCDQKQVGEAAS